MCYNISTPIARWTVAQLQKKSNITKILTSPVSVKSVACDWRPRIWQPLQGFLLLKGRLKMKEVWKEIPDYPGYEVSNFGRIRSYHLGNKRGISNRPQRIMSTKPTNKNGYPTVKLFKKGQKKKLRYVHHIVAKVFLGDRPIGLEVCHEDDNRLNNKTDNLCYGTSSKNKFDAVRNGKLPCGAKHYQAKVSVDEVIKIREMAQNGLRHSKIAAMYNNRISRRAVTHIANGATWKSVGGPIRGKDYD